MKRSFIQASFILVILFSLIHNVWAVNSQSDYAAFDLNAFKSDVNAVHHLDPKKVDPLRSMQREDGLRFEIELQPGSNFDKLKGKLKEAFQFINPIQLDPLFPETTKDKRLVELKLGLDRYYQLKFTKYAYEDLKFNVFDLAYFLRKLTGENKIDPDIPFKGFYPMSGSIFCNTHEPQTLDRAWPLRHDASGAAGTIGGMNIVAAWAYTRGQGIRIAHPDTGYNVHDDFEANQENIDLGNGYDTVDNDPVPIDPLNYSGWLTFAGHGMSTGSVMVSTGDVDSPPPSGLSGGTGPPGLVTGVAPRATLIPIRCMRSPVRLFFGSVVQAVDHAVALQPPNESHVISMSLGGLPSGSLKTAIDLAVSQNIIVLAAAGNYTWWVVYPAAFPNCIAVAASNVRDQNWSESARGPEVDFAAPGESVWRALRNDSGDPLTDAERGCGTSLSTAGVAGVAALWLAHHGRQNLINQLATGRTLQELFRAQVKKTVRVPAGWNTSKYGDGIVDAEKLLAEPVAQPVSAPSGLRIRTFSYRDIFIRMFGNENGEVFVKLLAEIFKPKKGKLEETINYWGAELSYLYYSQRGLYEYSRGIIDASRNSVQDYAPMLVKAITKYSSIRLTECLMEPAGEECIIE